MTLNELVDEAHRMAVRSGWWHPAKTPLECHMMVVTEIAEAVEACRIENKPHFSICLLTGKPDGEAVELADAVIRIADYFGRRGWNLDEIVRAKMDYNATRPHRHGNKLY